MVSARRLGDGLAHSLLKGRDARLSRPALPNLESLGAFMKTFDNRSVFLAVSGGYDSTCLMLYYALRGYRIHPVHFIYDSRQVDIEAEALKRILDRMYFNVAPLEIVELPISNTGTLSRKASPSDVESGEYKDHSSVSTKVPGRNLLFLSALANIAEAFKDTNPEVDVYLACGIHRSDWEQYPDTRPDFIRAAMTAIDLSTEGRVICESPFVDYYKHQLISVITLNGILCLPSSAYWMLGDSYSCYRAENAGHCGTCPTCRERHHAFMESFGCDPTQYTATPKADRPILRVNPVGTDPRRGTSEDVRFHK